ncbi:ORF; putative [Atkinsonella hypoxylon virus]|uniref:Capsid protein n=1 Tax=Atkinsonella hypoxylon virus (isolate 2H) TaxID=647331 RepID=CAPSD_AHV2H|nr:putative capsid protein [Atkinsonella hypoxylon virus]Q85056.1 RecName: Full=Capsid protein; Short=CP; AltName: Full=Coat protein [Atkinsonella hypoxylon virus isolate 2H]AAA61830.1 ORF; putative [Atkinsonella hypoxylon virus]prf//2114360B ORF [Atkinsonella hypoxylon virus]
MSSNDSAQTRNLQEERFNERTSTPTVVTAVLPDTNGPTTNSTSGSVGPPHPTPNVPVPTQSSSDPPSASGIFAKEIDLPRNVIQHSGNKFILDVVPDSRFPTFAITEFVQRSFSNFTFEQYSYVSPASLVGYLVYMIHAFVFLVDAFERSPMSAYASEIDASHAYLRIIDAFSDAYIPDFLFEILDTYLSHRLDIRSKLEMNVSYGSVLYKYDAPRIVAPSIFLLAHNQLISQSRESTAYEKWLDSIVIHYSRAVIRVGNLVGGLYQSSHGSTTTHFTYRNWFARSLSRLADSATHRTHLRRPMISEFDYNIPSVNNNTYNPYVHLLMLEPNNRNITLDFIRSLSSFCSTELKATRTLRDHISRRSAAISRCVIKGPEAPTWHSSPLDDLKEKSKQGNFSQFCEVAKFGLPRKENSESYTFKFPKDASTIDTAFYLIQENGRSSVLDPTTADEELHTEGMNLLFDPYDDESSAHYATVLSGKLIQNSNIDGETLLLPDPTTGLARTNSRYLQGSVLIRNVLPEFDQHEIRLFPRYPQISRLSASLTLLFNMRQVWIPRFKQKVDEQPKLSNFSWNEGCDGTVPSLNVVTAESSTNGPAAEQQVILWSSYRHVSNSDRPTVDTVYYYSTLELLFGTRSSMMQTYNLHQLLSLH